MAGHQAMQKCAFILALVACHEILMAEGRPIKLAPKNTSASAMHDKESQFIAPAYSNAGNTESDVPPAMHRGVSGFAESASVNKLDDFRPTDPTDPGNSPGVGHSFLGLKKEEVTSKAPSAGGGDLHTVADTLSDYRLTGHSPGVGHAYPNKNDEP